MKKLLLKSVLLVAAVVLTTAVIVLRISKNFSDRLYNKFTYRSSSMVIGASRALYGIDPERLQKANEVKKPFLNFAFTKKISPYGEVYYDAILKKLTGEKGGLFILEVSPVVISEDRDSTAEKQLFLGRMTLFNSDPNPDFFFNQRPLYLYLTKKKKITTDSSHVSGWVERVHENPDVVYKDSVECAQLISHYKISPYRMYWLEQTITTLSTQGTVVLVRMPLTKTMLAMENSYDAQFNAKMDALAKKYGSTYLDFSSRSQYEFIDLHHLTGKGAAAFSESLGDTLQKLGLPELPR